MKLKTTLLGIACAIITPVVSPKPNHDRHDDDDDDRLGTITEYAGSASLSKKRAARHVSLWRERYLRPAAAPRSRKSRCALHEGRRARQGPLHTEGEDRILNRVEIDDIEIDDD
jgi:hypothetical protein